MASADTITLTRGSVPGHLARLTLPTVFGLAAVLSQPLVDTFFVARLGTQPLAALSFTFPVVLAFTSLAVGLGAGASSVVSRALGAEGATPAHRPATDSLLLTTLVVLVLTGVGLATIRPLFGLLGAEGETLELLVRYMRIWYLSVPFLVVPITAHGIMRASGDAARPSLIMIAGALVNMVLTPMLMSGWGPLPALDIEGVAIATLVSRLLNFAVTVWLLVTATRLISPRLPPPADLLRSWRRVLAIAVPAGVGNLCNPLGIALVTAILATFSEATVAAFGVATRIETLACLPMLALSASVGGIAGQNWGAAQVGRVITALRTALAVCAVTAAAQIVVFGLWGTEIARAFASDEEVAREAALYLTIVPFGLWGYGAVINAAAVFNALGRSATGLGSYLVRIFALYVPLAWIAARFFGREEVWVSIAISNGIAGLLVGAYAFVWLHRAARDGLARAERDGEPATQPAG